MAQPPILPDFSRFTLDDSLQSVRGKSVLGQCSHRSKYEYNAVGGNL